MVNPRSFASSRLPVALAVFAGAAALAVPARAGTIKVSTKADDATANAHDNPDITLREAIELANGTRMPTTEETDSLLIVGMIGAARADTIQFAASFVASDTGGQPTTIDVEGSDLPALTDNSTTIQGEGRVRLNDSDGRGCGLRFRASTCTVSGVRVVGFDTAGFCLDPTDETTNGNKLLDCSGYGNKVGVLVSGAKATNNTISSASSAIPGTTAVFCQFGSAGNGQDQDGIRIDAGASGTKVDHCDIRENGPDASDGSGVHVMGAATGTTIGPLNVIGLNDYGILVASPAGKTTIDSNVIGTAGAAHGTDLGNRSGGIRVQGGPGNGEIKGNVVLWNAYDGIAMTDGSVNWVIDGNTVGETKSGGGGGNGISLFVDSGGAGPKTIEVRNNFVGFEGTSSPTTRANHANGIFVDANGTGVQIHDNDVRLNDAAGIRVGGTVTPITVQDNQVSDNGTDGILLQASAGSLAAMQTVTGNDARGNTLSGINMEGDGGTDTTISGNTANANDLHGIRIGPATSGATVTNNYAGTDSAASESGNLGSGIALYGSDNTVTGNTAGNNSAAGILLAGTASTGNVIKDNFCGVSGFMLIANGEAGIIVEQGAHDNTIGGAGEGNDVRGNPRGIYLRLGPGSMPPQGNAIGPENTVTQNLGNGVEVSGFAVNFNTITRNSIFSNTGAGIRLSSGGNGSTAAPIITSLSGDRASATIGGTIETVVALPAKVEIFTDDDTEGETWFAEVVVPSGTMATAGKYPWSYVMGPVPAGAKITATVTSTFGNTSEFSAAVDGPPPAMPEPPPEPTDAGSDAGTDAGSDAGTDAGSDAGIDAGSDAGTDAGSDAGTDSGTDAGTDAGVEPPPMPEPTPEPAVEPEVDGGDDVTGPEAAPDTAGPDTGAEGGDAVTADGPSGEGGAGGDAAADTGSPDTAPKADGKQDGPGLADGPKPGGGSGGGCSCRTGDAPDGRGGAASAAALLALALGRARRRRRD